MSQTIKRLLRKRVRKSLKQEYGNFRHQNSVSCSRSFRGESFLAWEATSFSWWNQIKSLNAQIDFRLPKIKCENVNVCGNKM